ncbi:competence type IV pilus minor pilin ComGE [Anoxybacillus sp. J5B_2022]|uniref:competence type IV pilus minor pilin ComGE n=1 Tax=Anoxybacillus sp. J5B_2022 TaxID=3003246 RepID=UPI002285507A|nr:competence type IV pilus minor pilin ComGE [Anoxybacillus sp. J5B_2022]MCZ0754640.1 competence type IV pilus minor pilin ComGE [Anoxybacillus sp. J5B_2022]
MYKNCNGFTFVEALVASAVLLMITIALLPLLTQIMVERHNVALKNKAQQLLHAEMNRDAQPADKTVTVAGVTYAISWTEVGNGMRKACVRWNDYVSRTVERCEYVKK